MDEQMPAVVEGFIRAVTNTIKAVTRLINAKAEYQERLTDFELPKGLKKTRK